MKDQMKKIECPAMQLVTVKRASSNSMILPIAKDNVHKACIQLLIEVKEALQT
jgi:hypothetical protein